MLAFAFGCSRCGEKTEQPAAVVDSGAPSTAVQGSLPATDLRSALFVIFPEFRATHVTGGEARFTRTFPFEGDLEAALRPLLDQQGYADAGFAGGEVSAVRPPFKFEAKRVDGQVAMSIYLPLSQEMVEKLIQSPSPLGTENMALMLPRLPEAKGASQTFEMKLDYVTKSQRAAFLTRQLVGGLVGSGWKSTAMPPDADAGDDPPKFDAVLTNAEWGARIELHRSTGVMRLRYLQPIR